MILVDATTYDRKLDADLLLLKQEYFRIKNVVRFSRLGKHNPPQSKTFSMGLLRIATILDRNGYEVCYVHFNDLFSTIVEKGIVPDIVAFSAVCPTVPFCSEMVNKLKSIYPNTKFAIGGAQLNVAPKTTKKLFNNFDVYALGYDVNAAEMIVGSELTPVNYIYADYSLLPFCVSEYAINTFATLGCPFSCNYCQDGLMPYNHVYSDGNIPFFMKNVSRKSCVHFFDSVLGAGNEKNILNICDNISKTNHDFILSCDFRADLLNEKILAAMVKAGFREIRMGVESADDELLSLNNRSLKVTTLLNAIKMIRENSDIYISLYSAIGFPGSTRQNIMATTSLLTELLEEKKIDEVKNCIFVPYPFDNARFSKEEIVIRNFDWRDYDRQSMPVYDLKALSAKEIWDLYLYMTSKINQSWKKGFSISQDFIDLQPLYGEYIVSNYVL